MSEGPPNPGFMQEKVLQNNVITVPSGGFVTSVKNLTVNDIL